MKTLIIFLGLYVLIMTACSSSKPSEGLGKAIPSTSPSQTSRDIIGVWTFVSNIGQIASSDKKVKIILDKNWMFSQPDPATNLTLFHHGGTYLLDGNNYAETINYANESTGGFLGQTFRYEVKIKGDTMTLKGLGNTPFSEIWKRAR